MRTYCAKLMQLTISSHLVSVNHQCRVRLSLVAFRVVSCTLSMVTAREHIDDCALSWPPSAKGLKRNTLIARDVDAEGPSTVCRGPSSWKHEKALILTTPAGEQPQTKLSNLVHESAVWSAMDSYSSLSRSLEERERCRNTIAALEEKAVTVKTPGGLDGWAVLRDIIATWTHRRRRLSCSRWDWARRIVQELQELDISSHFQ